MRKLALKKIAIIVACTVIAVPVLSVVVFYLLLFSGVMRYPNYGNISGIGRPIRYEHTLIAQKGEPKVRELIERENASDMYALHYEGITFFVSNNFVFYFDIISERYRLGGRGLEQNWIGIGSTRDEVEASYWRRRNAAHRWGEFPQHMYRATSEENLKLSNDGFGFRSRNGADWMFAEFKFDENDIVIKMRVGFWGF